MTVQEAKESIEYLKMQLTEDLEMICFTGDELKALDMSIQALEEVEQYRALGTVEEVTNQKHNLSVAYKCIEELQQPKADWIPCEDVLSMSESDFITHILSTICDYAKVNNYEITETVKAVGENLIALTEIANFDKWKEGVTDDE